MRNCRLFSLALALLAMGALAPAARPVSATTIVLDGFTDPLPPNPCLPNLGTPILFVGPYCDGAACPPDPLAGCWVNETLQDGLSGVLPGHPVLVQRGAMINTLNDAPATMRVRPESGRLEVEVGVDSYHAVQVSYGGSTGDLALDLTAAGATSLTFELFGDPTPTHPLTVSVSLVTSRQTPGGTVNGNANYNRTLDHPGTWQLPFSAFQASSEFSFAEVDFIMIEFSGDLITPGSERPSLAWALGPVGFETMPTASASSSWGRLKMRYR